MVYESRQRAALGGVYDVNGVLREHVELCAFKGIPLLADVAHCRPDAFARVLEQDRPRLDDVLRKQSKALDLGAPHRQQVLASPLPRLHVCRIVLMR